MKSIKNYFLFLLFSVVISLPFYFIIGISLNILKNIFIFDYPTASIIYNLSLIISVPVAHILLIKDIKIRTVVEYRDRIIEIKSKEYLHKRNMNIIKIIYFSIGLFVILFPPQYYTKEVYYKIYGKFEFILQSKSIDIYFILFELISYIFIGIVFYFLFIRKNINLTNKNEV